MIRDEQIPEAAAIAAFEAWSTDATWPQIIVALLNAWPGVEVQAGEYAGKPYEDIILPLQPEEG